MNSYSTQPEWGFFFLYNCGVVHIDILIFFCEKYRNRMYFVLKGMEKKYSGFHICTASQLKGKMIILCTQLFLIFYIKRYVYKKRSYIISFQPIILFFAVAYLDVSHF